MTLMGGEISLWYSDEYYLDEIDVWKLHHNLLMSCHEMKQRSQTTPTKSQSTILLKGVLSNLFVAYVKEFWEDWLFWQMINLVEMSERLSKGHEPIFFSKYWP